MRGFVLAFLLFLPVATFASSDYNPQSVGAGKPEIHIKADGTAAVRSARVSQIVGTTLYVGTEWGDVPVRFTVKTDAQTAVSKRYGGSAPVSHIGVGDYLDVDGDFFVGSDFLGVTARTIKDWSLQEEAGVFLGVVTELSANGFTLKTPKNELISVRVGTSTIIKKGAVSIPFGRLQKGDAIPRAAGVYDYASNTLSLKELLVYQAKTEFLPRNFEGVLKQVSSPSIPTTLVVTVGGTDYAVRISEKTLVQKKNRSAAQLARFVQGDTLRFFGPLREEEKTLQDALVVDAEVVRNLSL